MKNPPLVLFNPCQLSNDIFADIVGLEIIPESAYEMQQSKHLLMVRLQKKELQTKSKIKAKNSAAKIVNRSEHAATPTKLCENNGEIQA